MSNNQILGTCNDVLTLIEEGRSFDDALPTASAVLAEIIDIAQTA